MIPRLGDGNFKEINNINVESSLENDSPSRGRKLYMSQHGEQSELLRLENDSPSRGRKPTPPTFCLNVFSPV